MSLIELAIQKYHRDGVIPLIRSGLRLIRRVIHIETNPVWNGVEIPPHVASKHKLIDNNWLTLTVRTDYAKSEAAEVKSHNEFTQPGDTVIIVGGGHGVTTVHAARKSGHDGEVIVYEASDEHSDIIRKVVEMNSVETHVSVENALVGPDIGVYDDGENKNRRVITPQELPECDVLEMDCEGAELEIVRNLNIAPRIIIMEVHPQLYDQAPEAVDEIISHGYDIARYRTNEGELLTQTDFDQVLNECSHGDASAPIVVAVRNSV